MLGTVASGALLCGYARRAYAGPDGCTTSLTTTTCTGDQSAGISSGVGGDFLAPPTETLNVNSLTTGINSAASGIRFNSAGVVTINSDTGSFGILATGNGIYARSTGGGAVTVDSSGDITSTNSRGIIAFNIGATADTVSVTNVGDIQAHLEGIFAQSNTGSVIVESRGDITSTLVAGIHAYASGAGSVRVTNVGGAGGIQATRSGINARTYTSAVTVDSSGDITSDFGRGIYARTYGTGDIRLTNVGGADGIQAHSEGIYARSNTGAVTVNSSGDITSNNSRGIYASNYGVGAGDVSVTNTGGAGGIQARYEGIFAQSDTGAVTVSSTGDIFSELSFGIVALGTDDVRVLSAGDIQAYGAAILAHSSAGAVTVNSSGDITVSGSGDALGIYAGAQGAIIVDNAGSISAGSGGIVARSNTGTVTVNSSGDITSDSGRGIHASNSGAGAGDVKVTNVGGTGGIQAFADGIYATSNSGAVTVNSSGDITSDYGRGINASSGAGDVKVTNTGGADGIQADLEGIRATSSTGAVTVNSSGDIAADDGSGIAARSFAGNISVTNVGGASGIQAVSNGILARSYSGSVQVDSTGDIAVTGGKGAGIQAWVETGVGKVTVDNAGDIASAHSIGIQASADLGDVTIRTTGDITAADAGIVGQSLDGNVEIASIGNVVAQRIGIAGAAYGAGSVSIRSGGDVTATATSPSDPYIGTAILALGQAANDLQIDVVSGTVDGAAQGVGFFGGADNILTNAGTLRGGNFAILGTTGNETVNNDGLVLGNVDLGDGANAFNNRAAGTFASGATVNLGAGNTLSNAGNLSPGGVGTVQTTALTGNLVQTGTGTFTVDINEGGASDLVTIDGTASFAGQVALNILSLTSSSGQIVIADATGASSTTAGVQDTQFYDFSLNSGDGTQLVLAWRLVTLEERLPELTPNQGVTADVVDTAAPDDALTALFNAIRLLPDEAARAALDRLSPEHYLAQVNDTLHSSAMFLNSVMSCPTAAGANVEGECLWAKINGRDTDWDRSGSNIGGSGHAWSVSGGVQVSLGGNLRLGGALSYEDVSLSTNNAASSEGDRLEGAAVLKDRWGNTSAALAAFGGYGWFDTDRTIGFAGIDEVTGDHEIGFGGVHARLSHQFSLGAHYLKPMVDLNATYLDFGDIVETGGGAANLAIGGESEWVLSVSPAVELGTSFRTAGYLVRPFARLGVTVYDDTDFTLTSSFLAAPDGDAPFTIQSNFDETYVDVGAGVEVLSAGGATLKLNYDARLGDDAEMHSGGVKVAMPF